MCAFLLLLLAIQGPAKPPFAGLERRVYELINQQRRDHGVAELKWNDRLAGEARRHALNMAGRRFFSHVDPIRGDLGSRLKLDRIPWRQCAENIFEEQGYGDPAQTAVQQWMESPGHRKNILEASMTSTGVGVAVRGDGTYLFVQDFTRP